MEMLRAVCRGWCRRCKRCRGRLAQVRHGFLDCRIFWPVEKAKFRIFSAGSEKPACSVDLTSCLDGWLMTASSENVFAPQSSQQGWQRTHLLVVGGVGTHTRWTATKNFVSSGRAE